MIAQASLLRSADVMDASSVLRLEIVKRGIPKMRLAVLDREFESEHPQDLGRDSPEITCVVGGKSASI